MAPSRSGSRAASAQVYGPAKIAPAIDVHELVPHYQLQVGLTDGAWVGVEALVRWQHRTDGLIAPDAFVGSAEAHRLDMTVVAVGVEDRADRDAVRASGCQSAQGYFVARPMPADMLPDWAARWQQRFMVL